MRAKLFLAFFVVIAVALVSNFIYEQLMVRDFEEYISGTKEDKLYWILASVEGSYSENAWDTRSLHDAAHWAVMLGFDIRVTDDRDRELISSERAMSMLSPSMKRRMHGLADIGSATGEYDAHPLYSEGREIGQMQVRELGRQGPISEKQLMFKHKGREFLLTSFIIAGSGAVLLAVFFSLFLSRPLRRIKKAVEALARGDFSARVALASDRDELGRLAGSFNYMAEALEREEALRKRLTSNIAHELRTPLTIAKANVEAMLDGIVEDRQTGLENVRLEIERLIGLVEGIEDITKAEASFFTKNKYHLINLNEFLENIVAKLAPLAADKGLYLTFRGQTDLVVLTDADKVERILQNLLTNALKNTAAGGVTIASGKENDLFFIEISDTGAGIAEDQRELIFKRFYRGEASSGIGLGLAIVSELVAVLGGRITLQSTEGQGSSFTLWLPLQGK